MVNNIAPVRPPLSLPANSQFFGPIDLRIQAEVPSALRADTPTLVALADVTSADWLNRGAYGDVSGRRAQLVGPRGIGTHCRTGGRDRASLLARRLNHHLGGATTRKTGSLPVLTPLYR